MTDNVNESNLTEIPAAAVEAFQRRFVIPPDCAVEYHLFRLIAPKGPAQPVPAQIPIATAASRKEAVEMAEQYMENASIVIQRREWMVPVKKHGRTKWTNVSALSAKGDNAP